VPLVIQQMKSYRTNTTDRSQALGN